MTEPAELPSLIEQVRRADSSAAEQLVDRVYPLVLRIVRNHLPRKEQEEDLCQEVFLKVFSRIHQYRAEMPFEHWLSRIAVNTCIDHLRRQKVRPEMRWADFSEEQQAVLENWRESAVEPVERSPEEARELLEKLLSSLRPNERAIIQWLHLEQKSIQEISDLTGWSASKIKVAAFRARQKLMKLVQRLER